ncbi:MAG: hypothetical protein V7637_6010 [Mycobacteriales bacterium]|jgi:hypothetical protein
MELYTARWEPSTGWSRPLPAWDGPGTLVMAYGSSELLADPAPISALAAAYPSSHLVGCSTAGEILADSVTDESITVAVCRFADTRITLAYERVTDPGESYRAGAALARQLRAGEPDLKAIFVLSDGTGVNGSPLVAGLADTAGPQVLIAGGLAGDGPRFERTWVLVDGQPRSGYVSAVGLAGPRLRIGHGSGGGWDIFGPERRVTRSVGNVLFELDGQPALALYKKYLGDRVAGLPATALLFPLAVRAPGADDRRLVRTILNLDEETQSLTFAGDVPEGSLAQLMRANLDRLVDGAHAAAADSGTVPEGAALAVAVSCVGRRLILGDRTEDELEAVLGALPPGVEMIGFYSYGEIASIVAGTCDLHNETMTIATFWEAA